MTELAELKQAIAGGCYGAALFFWLVAGGMILGYTVNPTKPVSGRKFKHLLKWSLALALLALVQAHS